MKNPILVETKPYALLNGPFDGCVYHLPPGKHILHIPLLDKDKCFKDIHNRDTNQKTKKEGAHAVYMLDQHPLTSVEIYTYQETIDPPSITTNT
jgi:hypothetical protein